LTGALLFVEKVRHAAKGLQYFGLDCGTLEFFKSRSVIQRTIVDFPEFLEHGSTEKIAVCVSIQTVIGTSRRLDSFLYEAAQIFQVFSNIKN
jgi:hypothetical protein